MNMSNIGVRTAWKVLIQPERINYSMDNLGPKLTMYEKSDCYRKDFSFKNSRNNEIMVSLFIPIPPGKHDNLERLILNMPCVVYCHSQSGNRLEGLFLQDWCVENNYGLCLFDFNGCGKSKGEYVTLGWKEKDDLEQLINILTKDYMASQIVLWGRSMGAVTSIMYAKRHSLYLSAMILDSPFSDISTMVKDVAYVHLKVPGLLVSMALKLMSSTIKSKVHFDILKLKPAEFAKTCTVPCVFIIGKEDKIVLPKRVQEIFDAYAGKQKMIITSSGDHSDERESHIVEQCYRLLYQEIKKNSYIPRQTIKVKPEYVDIVKDNYLNNMSKKFLEKVETHIRESNTRSNIGNNLYKGHNTRSFNFDYDLNQTNQQRKHTTTRNQQMTMPDSFDHTSDKSDPNIIPIKDYGEVSVLELEKNLNYISLVIRESRF